MSDNEVVLVSAVRSAVGKGKKDGALATTHPIELSALMMREAAARANVDPATIDDVAWGCAMPEESQGLNVARLSALRAVRCLTAFFSAVRLQPGSALRTLML